MPSIVGVPSGHSEAMKQEGNGPFSSGSKRSQIKLRQVAWPENPQGQLLSSQQSHLGVSSRVAASLLLSLQWQVSFYWHSPLLLSLSILPTCSWVPSTFCSAFAFKNRPSEGCFCKVSCVPATSHWLGLSSQLRVIVRGRWTLPALGCTTGGLATPSWGSCSFSSSS